MPFVDPYRKGDGLTAQRLNETVTEVNKLVTGLSPPKQVDAPPDTAPGDEVIPPEQITYNEVFSERVTVVRRFENPSDPTVFVDVDEIKQVSFEATDQPKLVLVFVVPEPESPAT